MPTKDKEFNKKLKNCKSLQDYRDLEDEYSLHEHKTCPDYMLRIIRRRLKKVNKLQEF